MICFTELVKKKDKAAVIMNSYLKKKKKMYKNKREIAKLVKKKITVH